MRESQAKTRYCRLCGKVVPGLDHHCMWLNTCVSKRTYWAFFTVATAGVVQHTLGFLFGILLAAAWGSGGAPIAFGVVVAVLGAAGVGAYGSLWGFHLYLLYVGLGTYDWLLARDMGMLPLPAAPTVSEPPATTTAAGTTQSAGGVGTASVVRHATRRPAAQRPPTPPPAVPVPVVELAAVHADVGASERDALQERWECLVEYAVSRGDGAAALASPMPSALPLEFLPHLAAAAPPGAPAGSATRTRADYEGYERYLATAAAAPPSHTHTAGVPAPHEAGVVPPPPGVAPPSATTRPHAGSVHAAATAPVAPPPSTDPAAAATAADALRHDAIARIHEPGVVQPLVTAAAEVVLHGVGGVADPLAEAADVVSPPAAAAAAAAADPAAEAYDAAYYESKHADEEEAGGGV